MQQQNQNFSEFSHRTELLAEKLKIRLVDLPEVIGVSKAMLFAYRGGKNPISSKVWRKLEAAERQAGMPQPMHSVSRSVESEEAAERIIADMPTLSSRLAEMPPMEKLSEADAEFMRQNLPRMIQIMGRMQQSISPPTDP